ncbi:MAG: glycosyltransferase family 2 protein [Acidobacteriota bacterium]|nr:glycosyltransferase family 2 protein [Acidobacteriota bacterium]
MFSRTFAASEQNLVGAAVKSECSVCLIVPVHDEAECLPATLESFAGQVDGQGEPFNPAFFEIIIYANNCTDESAAIARRWQLKNPFLNIHVVEADLPPENSNIGYVRRLLMNEADWRLRGNQSGGGIIMTTDGDTRVAPNWIAANCREIENGAEAVGGRILINPAEIRLMDAQAGRFHLLDTGYRLLAAEIEARLDYVSHDCLPRHHQHFNGSFAVTTEAFGRAGGIPDVRFLEDVAFYQSLMRVDARFRHSPLVRVETSARHSGRAEFGLSTQINEWKILGRNSENYLVESAAAIERRIDLRRHLRDLWKSGRRNFRRTDLTALADDLFVPESFLQTAFAVPQTFGSLLEKIEHEQHRRGEWAQHYQPVAVEKALGDLRRILEKRRRECPKNYQAFAQTSSR